MKLLQAIKTVLTVSAVALAVTACNNDESMLQIDPKEETQLVGVYPNSEYFLRNHPKSRSENTFESNWENWDEITLNNGVTVDLPWKKPITPYTGETTFSEDIKKENGWMMLMHTFEDGKAVTPDVNYMFFYNRRTGYLKFFYYYTETYNQGNGGTWHLKFEDPQRWLNVTADIALPQNYGAYTTWEGLNPLTEALNSFAKGWNCIQLQLAYQSEVYPEMKLDISAYNYNWSELYASTELEAFYKGVISSKTTGDGLSDEVNSMANISGKSAEAWFKENIVPYSNQTVVARGSDSSLLDSGVTLLMNLFTTTTQSTTSNIDLKASFKGNIAGRIATPQRANISAIKMNVGKKYIGTELGAWNLKTSPIVYIHPVGVLEPSSEFNDAMYYNFRSSGKYKYDIEFNPDLKNHIKSYKVEILPVRYSLNDTIINPVSSFDYGTLGTSSSGNMETGNFGLVPQSELLFGEYRKKGSLYNDLYRSQNYFEGIKRHYGIDVNNSAPQFVYLPDVENYIRGGRIKFNNAQHPVRVVLTMVTTFEGKEETTVSSRTYIPKIEWDPELLQRYNKGHVNNLNEYLKSALSSDPILQSQVKK